METPTARTGVPFSVAVTEFAEESKKVESNAPSEESTCVADGIAVGACELAVSARCGVGMRAGTSAAVNCAAAAVGAAASAMVAATTAQVLTEVPPVTF